MKIYQKLILGFLGASLLAGIISSMAIFSNLKIKYDVSQLTTSSIQEVASAQAMLVSLQELQLLSQKLIAEQNLESSANHSDQVQKAIAHEIEDFDQQLFLSKQAIQAETQPQQNHSIKLPESAPNSALLAQLESSFDAYKQLINQYQTLAPSSLAQANQFLENVLEPHVEVEVLPSLQKYEQRVQNQLFAKSQIIEQAINNANQLIVVLTVVILLITILIGLLIANSISQPITQLKDVATRIGRGQLGIKAPVKSKDEIGILANAFNEMVDELSKTTVSKFYVDNILNSMAESLVVIETDATIKKVNQAALCLLGYAEDELLNQHIQKILGQEIPFTLDYIVQVGCPGNIETTYQAKSGDQIPVAFSSSLMRDQAGEIQGIVCIARDISDRKQAEKALRESEERYALAACGANDGLWDWNLKTDEIYFSPRWKSMLGYEETELGNTPDEWLNRVHPEDVERMKLELAAHIEGITTHFEVEYPMLHKDGTYHWMLSRGLAVRDANHKAYRMAGSQTDITERKTAEEQLLHDAFHDALTGLPNRALFMDRLKHVVDLSKRRENYLFAVLFLDLDRFKMINDSLGHLLGDQLLVAIARKLKSCLRAGDTVARLGGDEFAILLEDIKSGDDATDVANRIQQELVQPLQLNGQEVFTTASIGIALSSTGYDRPDDLLRDADTAMYRAKASGKARYEVFDKTMHTRAVMLLQLENNLRRAIERQEFQLHYQPIISLATGNLIGFEALVRWQHPDCGLVSPADFIPIAEETGLIVPLGAWVLREACAQMQQWQQSFHRNPPLYVSVNLSSKQFAQHDLMEQVTVILQETQFDPHYLKLEITESVLLENPETTSAMLQRLQDLGIQVSIDDFGTGYSSLSYLHRLPINTLKIDRSFINSVDIDAEKLELVRTIVTLAWNLGLDVVAEGVETPRQLAQLKALKCEAGQGYFFSRPMDSQGAEALLKSEST